MLVSVAYKINVLHSQCGCLDIIFTHVHVCSSAIIATHIISKIQTFVLVYTFIF